MRALAVLLLVQCGGEAVRSDASTLDAQLDAVDAAVDAGPIDISGETDLAISVLERVDKTTAPLAGVAVRVENGGFLEAVTDAAGVAHVKVDTFKGPFDVTAARTGYTFVSIVGVTGPLTEPIIVAATKSSPQLVQHPVTGAINGKINAANPVQLGGWWWNTVVTAAATYSGNFATALSGSSPPLSVAAIEVDKISGKVANAVMTPPIARPQKTTTLDVTLPGSASGWTTSVLAVNWPQAGLLRGSDVTMIGEPADGHLGPGVFVTKKSADMFEVPMLVGVGTSTFPMSGQSTITVQTGPGDFTPDTCEIKYVANDWLVRVRFTSIANGANAAIGSIAVLDGSGTSLDDFTFRADVAGYDASALILNPQAVQPEDQAYWTVWAPAKLSPHRIPHLPSAVKAADTFYTPQIDVHVSGVLYQISQWSEKQPVVIVDKWVKAIDPGSQ